MLHIGPAVGHPLEFVIALEEVEVGDAARGCGLCISQRWSHDCEHDFDAVRLQRASQLECVRPHATDRVGSHENALWCLSHSAHVYNLEEVSTNCGSGWGQTNRSTTAGHRP